MTKEYLASAQKIAIQEFIKRESRSPTIAELNILTQEIADKYYAIDDLGYANYELEYTRFRSPASATQENRNRNFLLEDLLTLNKRLDNLYTLEEDAHTSIQGTIIRNSKILDELLLRVDNIADLYKNKDGLLYGIEESFTSLEKIDQNLSTATIENGAVTINKRRFKRIAADQCSIKYAIVSDKGYLSVTNNHNLKNLLKEKGSPWQAVINTTYQNGIVELVLEVTLKEKEDISEIQLVGLPIGNNSAMYVNVTYSVDGSSFNSLDIQNTVLKNNSVIPVGKSQVKKIQITLRKEHADCTKNNNEFEYIYSLDKIIIRTSKFNRDKISEVICGPYVFTKSDGITIQPSKASLSACTLEPKGTGINFSISLDQENWIPINHVNKGSNYLILGYRNNEDAIDYIDSFAGAGSLQNTLTGIDTANQKSAAFLNTYIKADYKDYVSLNSIAIYRNISSNTNNIVLNTSPGWHLDKRGMYQTTIYIDNPSGRFIDFGPNGALLNKSKVVGITFVPYGYSTFETNKTNWFEIDNNFSSEDELKKADALYPYNHKYVIEGYNYSSAFSGRRVYSGVKKYFGTLLQYISPEEFEVLSVYAPEAYNVFTTEESEGNVYFKVKVDKHSATWQNELYDIDIFLQATENNGLYVKAILTSINDLITPVLESFKLRVI